jgi:hypothetical protein
MAPSKPYTSQDVARLVNRWQICCFFDVATDNTIISIAAHDLYRKNSTLRCAPEALEKIKTALKKAYDQGIREVGLFAPHALRIELMDTALSITDDPDWLVSLRAEMPYIRDMLATQSKIWNDETFNAKMDEQLKVMEKQVCDSLGFTNEVLLELLQYIDVEKAEDLPPHLRALFADGTPEVKKEQ